LAGNDPVPVKFGFKDTEPHYEARAFNHRSLYRWRHTRHAVNSL